MAGDRRLSRPDASLPDWEVPDTSYRPIPIVWFTAALLSQLVLVAVLFSVVAWVGGAIVVALMALGSGGILAWTWDRGMKSAGAGWKIATIVMLALNLLFAGTLALSF